MHYSRAAGRSIALAACMIFSLPASAHISPTTELVGRDAAVRTLLAGAVKFTVEKIRPSRGQLRELRTRFGLRVGPETYRLYRGRDAQGRLVGVVIFVHPESVHGPVEVAVATDANRAVIGLRVTRTQAEPLAWIRAVVDAGVLDDLQGATLAGGPGAEAGALPLGDLSSLGRMERYYASIIRKGVHEALALRAVLDPPDGS